VAAGSGTGEFAQDVGGRLPAQLLSVLAQVLMGDPELGVAQP
jgi:hypothetical protein